MLTAGIAVASVNKLSRLYGGMSNNQGAVAEQYYFKSLQANPRLQGMHFQYIYKNMTGSCNKIQDEYDIVLVNSKSLFIIEVKYKAHPNDLKNLLEKKAPHFPQLFKEYAHFERYLGLACFYIDDELIKSAVKQGISILQRKDDIIETWDANTHFTHQRA